MSIFVYIANDRTSVGILRHSRVEVVVDARHRPMKTWSSTSSRPNLIRAVTKQMQ